MHIQNDQLIRITISNRLDQQLNSIILNGLEFRHCLSVTDALYQLPLTRTYPQSAERLSNFSQCQLSQLTKSLKLGWINLLINPSIF